MIRRDEPDSCPELRHALGRLREALRLLDEAGAPGDIAAHLDLALARLERHPEVPLTGALGAFPWDIPRSTRRADDLIGY